MKNIIESTIDGNDLVWLFNSTEIMRIKNKKWFSMSWKGVSLSDKEKFDIIKNQLIFNNDSKIEFLLKKNNLNKIKLEMEKKFRTSYTDIMIKIVTMNTKLDLEPIYGTECDYDSYNEKLGYCIDKIVKSHENKYGKF